MPRGRAATAGEAPRQAGPPLEPLQVVYVGKTTALLPYWVARDDGAFTRNGLNVEFQQLPDADTAYVYLNNSAAQVYLTPLDTTLVARVANGSDLAVLGGQPGLAIVTLRPLLASRELIMERFLRGVLEGIHTLEARPESGAAVLAREGLSAPAGSGPRVAYLSADDLTPLLNTVAATDPARRPRPEPPARPDHLRRSEASGFVAALYRS